LPELARVRIAPPTPGATPEPVSPQYPDSEPSPNAVPAVCSRPPPPTAAGALVGAASWFELECADAAAVDTKLTVGSGGGDAAATPATCSSSMHAEASVGVMRTA